MDGYDWAGGYEPDYNAYCRELESYEEAMADVATYDDWFVEEAV